MQTRTSSLGIVFEDSNIYRFYMLKSGICPFALSARLCKVASLRPTTSHQTTSAVTSQHQDPPPLFTGTINPTNDAMPILRPVVALRAANTISSGTRVAASSQATSQQQCVRAFSTSRQQMGADHGAHEDHYDPPTGWLWGQDPNKKYEKEGWENVFFYGFFGSLGLFAVAYAFKPDTS